MKNKLLFFLAFLWSTWSFGQDFSFNGINYQVTSDVTPLTVSVSKNINFTGDAVIPETVEYNNQTYAVTDISQYAFEFCTDLTSVTISNSVTSIGEGAFAGCTSLTSFKVNWITPIAFDESVFQPLNLADVTLYVPSGTTASYIQAGWEAFGSIVESTPATHLNFDGVDDRIELDNTFNFNFTTTFSIECWIQVSSFTKEWQTIISKGTEGPRIHRYGNSDFIAFGTGGANDLKSITPVNDGQWHHIAATFSNGTKTLYVDGVLEATGTVGYPLGVNNTNIRIGSQSDDYSDLRNFNGNIDEVRFWNVARTETEINFSKDDELKGNETGLLAYYKFNQGAATENNTAVITLTDATPNANNGTLSGFAKTGTISNFLEGSPVNTPTAPTAYAQKFCETTTVASLVPAPGATIFWYADDTTTSALNNTDAVVTGTYYVATANANGYESSRTPVNITVTSPAVISVQPKNQTFVEDQAITFTVTATDVTSYQWELSPDGTEWVPLDDNITDPDVSGANSNSLTISGNNLNVILQFKFRVVLNAEACPVISEEVRATDETLGNSSFEKTNFSYYPNPTNGILNIDYSKDIQQVTVLNMLGKLVQETQPNTSNAKVDLSSLAAGNYLVQVKANEEIKTIKIVKK